MWAPRSLFRSWNVVERVCFPAPTPSYTIKSFPDELILIPGENGEKVPCLFLPFRHARFLFIYFHANAEDLGLCYTFCTIIRDLFQVHILAVEYPGYGICPGTPTEEGIRANAQAANRFVLDVLNWPCDGIKLFGRSIGTGAALALAAEKEMAGLILVTPFTSIREIVRHQIGPLADLMSDRFPNIELAFKIESPTLIIHGQQDNLIPLSHSKAIYDAVPAKKMMVCPALMGHNTSLLANVGTFVMPMTQFFSLPDYTFEDIEVPDWVFPDLDRDETVAEENQWVCASSDWMPVAMTPRRAASTGMAEWRARGCFGGGTTTADFPLPVQLQQPVNSNGCFKDQAEQPLSARGPPGAGSQAGCLQTKREDSSNPNPDTPLGIDAEKVSLKASRHYDFRTPQCSPRGDGPNGPRAEPSQRTDSRMAASEKPPTLQGDPQSSVVDCPDDEEEQTAKDVAPASGQAAPDQLSEDMMHAITTGSSLPPPLASAESSNDTGAQAKAASTSSHGSLPRTPEETSTSIDGGVPKVTAGTIPVPKLPLAEGDLEPPAQADPPVEVIGDKAPSTPAIGDQQPTFGDKAEATPNSPPDGCERTASGPSKSSPSSKALDRVNVTPTSFDMSEASQQTAFSTNVSLEPQANPLLEA